MATPINDLIDDLYGEVPAAPDKTLERALRWSVRHFMRETELWRTVTADVEPELPGS